MGACTDSTDKRDSADHDQPGGKGEKQQQQQQKEKISEFERDIERESVHFTSTTEQQQKNGEPKLHKDHKKEETAKKKNSPVQTIETSVRSKPIVIPQTSFSPKRGLHSWFGFLDTIEKQR